MNKADKLLSIVEEILIPNKDIVKAMTSKCLEVMKAGYSKPEFHVDHKTNCILSREYEDRGIVWGGDYAEFDSKSLLDEKTSLVYQGDKVTAEFHHIDEDGDVGDIAGEVNLYTDGMRVLIDYE